MWIGAGLPTTSISSPERISPLFMVVNPSRRSRRYGRQCKQYILTETSSMETSIATRSCHQSLAGPDYSSCWTRTTTIETRGGTQLCIARSFAMQTRGAFMLASTRSPNSKVFLKKSGKGCLTRYQSLIPGLRLMIVNTSTVQTQTIWLKFFGDTLHGNRSLARIALRASLGEEPTEAQIAAKCESIKPANIRKALAEKLRNDVRRAFSRGEEVRQPFLPPAPPGFLTHRWVRHTANSRLGDEMCFVRLRV